MTKNQCVVLRLQQLVKLIKEYSKNVQILKATVQQALSQTSTYKISIEEQTPPVDIIQQKQNCITSYDGMLLWKIDNIIHRLSM